MEIIFKNICVIIYTYGAFYEKGGYRMHILKKINQLRIERGWSIYRLSVESGIPQSTLTNMFNRETLPSITTLECLCEAFGISMSSFFAETDEIPPNDEKELLALYAGVSDEAKQAVLSLLKELHKK